MFLLDLVDAPNVFASCEKTTSLVRALRDASDLLGKGDSIERAQQGFLESYMEGTSTARALEGLQVIILHEEGYDRMAELL